MSAQSTSEAPTYIIGLFDESDLMAHYASATMQPELRVMRETLTLLGHEALIGSVKVVALSADPEFVRATIDNARELQFKHSCHGEDSDEAMAAYYGNVAEFNDFIT